MTCLIIQLNAVTNRHQASKYEHTALPQTQKTILKALSRIERIANIGHWYYDLKDNSLFWSEEVFRIHGLDFDDYTPNVDAAIDAYLPQDRETVELALSKAIEDKESFEFQKRIRRPGGEVRHVIARGECELDDKNTVTAIFGTIQDITKIKLQEELYELAALGSNAALWDWDVKKETLRWAGNSAEILGFKNKKDLPQTTEDFAIKLLHPDDRKKLNKAFVAHFKNQEEFAIDLRLSTTGKHYRWFKARAQAQWEANGRAIRICGSLNDVHDLVETQEKLAESNEGLREFATIAAHDLKAPLRSIGGFLQILKDKHIAALGDEALEYLDYSINGANDLGVLVEDLLQYASLQADGITPTEFNLDKMLKRSLRTMKATIKEKNAKIDFEKLPTVICDEHKITRLFYNLIENALKYSTKTRTPHIEIGYKKKINNYQFHIRDNGIGIPPEKCEDIFLMFQRLHKKTDYTGTGIGLAICKKTIALHGGQIWVESELDRGSTFFFTIPFEDDAKDGEKDGAKEEGQ